MNQDSDKLRLFVDPFATWRELALKTAELIAVSAYAGAARVSALRVAVIDQREPLSRAEPLPQVEPVRQAAVARKASTSALARPKTTRAKKHKKRAKRR